MRPAAGGPVGMVIREGLAAAELANYTAAATLIHQAPVPFALFGRGILDFFHPPARQTNKENYIGQSYGTRGLYKCVSL